MTHLSFCVPLTLMIYYDGCESLSKSALVLSKISSPVNNEEKVCHLKFTQTGHAKEVGAILCFSMQGQAACLHL